MLWNSTSGFLSPPYHSLPLILFPSFRSPSPSRILFLLLHPLSLPFSSRGYFFLFHLHLAFSALLCPTQGESTSFQTQPYFRNTSRSSESSVRPRTLLLVPLHECVPFDACLYERVYNVSDWQDMPCHQESSPTRCWELQTCFFFPLFFSCMFFLVCEKPQVNY